MQREAALIMTVGTRAMSQPIDDSDDGMTEGQYEYDPVQRNRQMQRRMNNQIKAAESQIAAAHMMETNAKYMLWSVVISCGSTIVAAAAAVFSVYASFYRVPH